MPSQRACCELRSQVLRVLHRNTTALNDDMQCKWCIKRGIAAARPDWVEDVPHLPPLMDVLVVASRSGLLEDEMLPSVALALDCDVIRLRWLRHIRACAVKLHREIPR